MTNAQSRAVCQELADVKAERDAFRVGMVELTEALREANANRVGMIARVRDLEAELASANEMCMSAYGSTASSVLAENDRLKRGVEALRAWFADDTQWDKTLSAWAIAKLDALFAPRRRR